MLIIVKINKDRRDLTAVINVANIAEENKNKAYLLRDDLVKSRDQMAL